MGGAPPPPMGGGGPAAAPPPPPPVAAPAASLNPLQAALAQKSSQLKAVDPNEIQAPAGGGTDLVDVLSSAMTARRGATKEDSSDEEEDDWDDDDWDDDDW
jgi:hypothetical protein